MKKKGSTDELVPDELFNRWLDEFWDKFFVNTAALLELSKLNATNKSLTGQRNP